MSRTALWVLAAVYLASAAVAQTVTISGPPQSELKEGRKYTLAWSAGGAEMVNIAIVGTRTPLGQQSRGKFLIRVAEDIPAAQSEHEFTLPWIDALRFRVIINGYSNGRVVSSGYRDYRFRPAVLSARAADGIYLDLHKRVNQRLYVQKDLRITHVYLSSSSEAYHWLPPNRHIAGPHDHAGVYKVLDKSPDHWSQLYEVRMLWAMHYLGGHYIHATSPNLYRYLGTPASHGCNRLTRYDAHHLYDMTPAGTRVEVIGPDG